MVRDSSSPDNDPGPAQMVLYLPHNGPAVVQNQPVRQGFHAAPDLVPRAFARHPTIGPHVSHFLNHPPVSGFYPLTNEIQIGGLYLGVRSPCVLFMSCHRDVVWHSPSWKRIS